MAFWCNVFKFSTSHPMKHRLMKPVVCGFNVFSRKLSEYEVVIAGGGSGGISTGARLSKALGKNKVAIIDPADVSFVSSSLVYKC